MVNDEPLAFFITWTVYGTFLQGDDKGWRKRRNGNQLSQPLLAQWHRDRLKHSIELLNDHQRQIVMDEMLRLSGFRGWHVWAHDARTNHCHVVVTAAGNRGDKVRDQLKANCSRVLRERWPKFIDRPVWTTGGDWRCLNNEDQLAIAVEYVVVAQDRMGFRK